MSYGEVGAVEAGGMPIVNYDEGLECNFYVR